MSHVTVLNNGSVFSFEDYKCIDVFKKEVSVWTLEVFQRPKPVVWRLQNENEVQLLLLN